MAQFASFAQQACQTIRQRRKDPLCPTGAVCFTIPLVSRSIARILLLPAEIPDSLPFRDLPLDEALGREMYDFAARIFPLFRSLTGPGVRATLAEVSKLLPGLQIQEVPSGTRCFDWTVPDEWSCREAWVEDETGRRIIDIAEHNLHVVGYSEPVDTWVSRAELEARLHSIPELPDAIPYVTSYYRRTWGFCLQHRRRQDLVGDRFRVRIDSTLAPGHLTYGELVIPGKSEQELLFSTYVCHPSLANNEISGPTLATFLARWLSGRDNRYTCRVLFLPETIGAIVYLSQHLDALKRNLVAGFILTCVGDTRAVSFMPSRHGGTLADRAALSVLEQHAPGYLPWSFLKHRGSDERQYCAPGVDLPVVSIMRSRYGTYPEYHTSLDDLSVISPEGLAGSLALHQQVVELLETNQIWQATCLGEPQLSTRNLRESTGGGRSLAASTKLISDVLAMSDSSRDTLALAELLACPFEEVDACCRLLEGHGLLRPSVPTTI